MAGKAADRNPNSLGRAAVLSSPLLWGSWRREEGYGMETGNKAVMPLPKEAAG